MSRMIKFIIIRLIIMRLQEIHYKKKALDILRNTIFFFYFEFFLRNLLKKIYTLFFYLTLYNHFLNILLNSKVVETTIILAL